VAVGVAFKLLPKTVLQSRKIELVLAQQDQLAALLQAQKVRQSLRPDAFARAACSSSRYIREKQAGSSRSIAPAKASHRAP
jgi:hypothetical protein